jgi:pimeloyl-ACP methyl ester carboxylesterase
MTRNGLLTLALSALLLMHCQSKSDGAASESAAVGAAASTMKGGTEDVRFTTSDGVVITGTLYAAGAKAPAVLCLHQWRSDRGSFASLARGLQQAGFTVLAIDMRGYGGSLKTADGKSVRPDRKARLDVEAAVSFLRGHASVDPARIGIIGASYGSSNALLYAAGDASVKALVLLSPGLNYFNELPTEDAIKKVASRPIFAVASKEDVRSVETLDAYAKVAKSMRAERYDNAGHGTDILAANVGLERAIVEFLKKNL